MSLWMVVVALFVVIWIWRFPKTFPNCKFEELDRYIYTILYRGYAEEFLVENACMIIRSSCRLEVYKYKEKGEIGLYITVDRDKDLLGKDKEFLAEVKKRGLIYFTRKVNEQVLYVLDMKQGIDEIKSLIKFVLEKIFEEQIIFSIFYRDICKNPNKLIDFDDTMELEEKGIDIKIPITDGQWLLWKLRNWGKKI